MLRLHERRGIEYAPQVADSELDAYEELADVVRKNVDMVRVCEFIGVDV